MSKSSIVIEQGANARKRTYRFNKSIAPKVTRHFSLPLRESEKLILGTGGYNLGTKIVYKLTFIPELNNISLAENALTIEILPGYQWKYVEKKILAVFRECLRNHTDDQKHGVTITRASENIAPAI